MNKTQMNFLTTYRKTEQLERKALAFTARAFFIAGSRLE
ncbi:hypothetical protein P7266_1144 [Lactococcus cremoris]|nr:hypothetical protein P7266_1144 [Lactococcus cremoris]